jgi:DNA-binding MarR family transcriptional regulator
MTGGLDGSAAFDPVIHKPVRLRIVATLAALPDGDALSVARLRDLTGLTPGILTARLRELDEAGYAATGQAARGGQAQATVALTRQGRAALDRYVAVLRNRPSRLAGYDHGTPATHVRIGDSDRDATAAALGEHFAQGRLTLDELHVRLGTTLTATTYGELRQALRDLP